MGIFTLLVFGVFFLTHYSTVHAEGQRIPAIDRFIKNGGYALSINGQTVRSLNLNQPFIPASTVKLLTGLMALDIFGEQHRFSTAIFRDDDNILYIKGEGDPFLTSEAISRMAIELSRLNINTINKLVFDDSAFKLEGPPPQSDNSDNPYDAPSGALAVNFNTLTFRVLKDGKIRSGESQTPFLPIMKDLASGYPQGRHRVNVNGLPAAGKLANDVRYRGELFTAIFKKHGIDITGGFGRGKVADSAKPLMEFYSEKTVIELVQLCLEFSNNFIANQLFLACGAKYYGYPATWKKAIAAGQHYVQHYFSYSPDQLLIVDGSGLSTENRLSAEAMLQVLEKFRPYSTLLTSQDSVYLKSGTLTHVYSYAGYFQSSTELSPFVFFLNQRANTRNTVLKLLKKEHSSLTRTSP